MKVNKKHQYSLTVKWTGNTGKGTSDYRAYERNHTVTIKNKPDILCSSDPVFRGDKTKYNPEELFLAAISSCHMLEYLHLCADAGIVVVDYVDNPEGTMIETEDGGGNFVDVVLYPIVTVSNKSMINKAIQLHERAYKLCFIANSCNFAIHHEPACRINDGENISLFK